MADTFTLQLVQGQRYERAFRYTVDAEPLDLADHSWAAQARQKESDEAELLIDLTPFLSLDDIDPTLLLLEVPATATAQLEKAKTTANWDLFLWPTTAPEDAFCLIQGPVTVDLASTDIAEALA